MRPLWLRAALDGMMRLEEARGEGTSSRSPMNAHGSPHGRRTLLLSPFINSGCFSWADWWALAPRSVARRYFAATKELSCDWLSCVERAYGTVATEKSGYCIYQERLLVEWLLAAPGVAVAAAPHHPLAGAIDGRNSSEVDDALGWCVGSASLPPRVSVLQRLQGIARGEGKQVVTKLLANEHAERGPIIEGDLRFEQWHRPLRMRACAHASDEVA